MNVGEKVGERLSMTLDSSVQYFHVRECDNCVRVTITRTRSGTYVCYERLVLTDEVDEGQIVSRWEHVKWSSHRVGIYADEMSVAEQFYRTARESFSEKGLPL